MVGQYSDSTQEELIRNDRFQGHTPESPNLEFASHWAMRCVHQATSLKCVTPPFFSRVHTMQCQTHNFSLGPLFLRQDLWGGGFRFLKI